MDSPQPLAKLLAHSLPSYRPTVAYRPLRDAAVAELKGISAGEDERRRMLDILQRLHLQEVEGSGGGSSDDEGSEEEGAEGGLSQQTLHRLLAKVRPCRGGSAACLVSHLGTCCWLCRDHLLAAALHPASPSPVMAPAPPGPPLRLRGRRCKLQAASWKLLPRTSPHRSWPPSTAPWQTAS